MNIGVYDVASNKIVICWNNVTNIERQDSEVRFLQEGISKSFYARQDNYVIVDSSITLYEGMEVTPELLNQDQKAQFNTKDVTQLQEEIKAMQEAINFLLGI